MGTAILARSGSLTIFGTELVVGAVNLTASWLGMQRWGVAGLGVGFLATYIAHYLVVWTIMRKDIGLVWTSENKRMFVGAVLAVAFVRLLPALGMEVLRMPIALSLAALAGMASLHIIWQEVGGLRGVRS
jgi:hypothetical protein